MSHKNTENRKKNIAAMMKAESLAIVGISGLDRFGGQVYANLQLLGYKGKIYGVNPRYETLYDQKIYSSLSDLPEVPDCAILALPNSRLLPVMEEASELSIPSAIIYASAYGEENGILIQDALARTAEKSGMMICGPNSMGLISFAHKLPMSGYQIILGPPVGNITFISHSGSVWEAMMQNNRGIHYNYVISAGNEMVTTLADYMLFVLSDPGTKVVRRLRSQPIKMSRLWPSRSGFQARDQIRGLRLVRDFQRLMVHGIIPEDVERYASEMTKELGVEVIIADGPEEVFHQSQFVATTTPSREPYVKAAWLHPVMHITAMGSDGEHKSGLEFVDHSCKGNMAW